MDYETAEKLLARMNRGEYVDPADENLALRIIFPKLYIEKQRAAKRRFRRVKNFVNAIFRRGRGSG